MKKEIIVLAFAGVVFGQTVTRPGGAGGSANITYCNGTTVTANCVPKTDSAGSLSVSSTVSAGSAGTAGCWHLYDMVGTDTAVCSPSTANGAVTVGGVQAALTGADIGAANTVTSTHLAVPLPLAQGGTASAVGSVGTIWFGHGNNAAGSAAYMTSVPTPVITTNSFPQYAPFSGTITALYCTYNSLVGSGKTGTFTVLYDGSTSGTPTCTSAANGFNCSATGLTFPIVEGHTLQISDLVQAGGNTEGAGCVVKVTGVN